MAELHASDAEQSGGIGEYELLGLGRLKYTSFALFCFNAVTFYFSQQIYGINLNICNVVLIQIIRECPYE